MLLSQQGPALSPSPYYMSSLVKCHITRISPSHKQTISSNWKLKTSTSKWAGQSTNITIPLETLIHYPHYHIRDTEDPSTGMNNIWHDQSKPSQFTLLSRGVGESQTRARVVSNSVPSSYSHPRTPISCPACSPANQGAATTIENVNSAELSTTKQIRQTRGEHIREVLT